MKMETILPLSHTIDRVTRGVYSGEIPFAGYVPAPALIPDPAHRTSQLLFLSFVTARSPDTGKTAIFRPRAMMLIDRRGKLNAYRDYRAAGDQFPSVSWSTPLALWPHKGAETLSVKDYMATRKVLFDRYEAELAAFPGKRALSADFVRDYRLVTHPIVLPFLKELAPHFVTALMTENPA